MVKKVSQLWATAPKVKVRGDQSLKQWVGNKLQFMYGDVMVSLPLDGKYHEFPDFVAKVLQDKMQMIGEANSPHQEETSL